MGLHRLLGDFTDFEEPFLWGGFFIDNNCSFKRYLDLEQYREVMDKWITVLTSSSPQRLWTIRGRLESEGIECFIKDELNVRSSHLYSKELGRVKLRVLQEDGERVLAILKELGYLEHEPARPDLLSVINKKTTNFFLLNKLAVTKRIIVLVFLGSLILGTILYFIFSPDTCEALTSTSWCVSKIYFNSKLIRPKTQNAFYVIIRADNGKTLNCEELDMRKDKDVVLPGINSSSIWGKWVFNDDKTVTIRADSLGSIYNGVYNVDVSYMDLTLKSKTTVIYANRMNL